MPEDRPSRPSPLDSLRESLSRDGHFTENVVSLIAHSAAQVRRVYPNLPDAVFKLQGAFIGKTNLVSHDIVDTLTIMALVLRNSELSTDAQNAGIICSPNQAKELDDAFRRGGFPALRQVALKLTLLSVPNQPSVNLSDRIKATPTQR